MSMTAETVQQLVTDRPRAAWEITTHGGATAPRAYIHAIWPDRIVCGTRDEVHATYRLENIASIRPATPRLLERRPPPDHPSYADADQAGAAELVPVFDGTAAPVGDLLEQLQAAARMSPAELRQVLVENGSSVPLPVNGEPEPERWGPATPTTAGTAYLAGYRDGAADTRADLGRLQAALDDEVRP